MKKLLLSLLGLVLVMSNPVKGMSHAELAKEKMPQTLNDAAKILGVKTMDPENTVKKAYQKLIKQYHPDIYKGTDANALAHKINAAYVLFEKKFDAINDAIKAEAAKKEKAKQQKRAQARAQQSSSARTEEEQLKAASIKKQIEIDKAEAARKKIDTFVANQKKTLSLNDDLKVFLTTKDLKTDEAKAELVDTFTKRNVAFQLFASCEGCGKSLAKMNAEELKELSADILANKLDLKNPEKFAQHVRGYVQLNY